MFSKLMKPMFGWSGHRCGVSRVLVRSPGGGAPALGGAPARSVWGIPPSQYDMALPKKLQLSYVCRVHWELIPVFAVTFLSGLLVLLAFAFAARNKVDVVFSTHSRRNISRTMDLRSPTVHKALTLAQRTEPWPEMQDVLDKMQFALDRLLLEEQALADAPPCKHH